MMRGTIYGRVFHEREKKEFIYQMIFGKSAKTIVRQIMENLYRSET